MAIQVLHACLAVLALYFVERHLSKKRSLLPPGPPGWPLIGNLLDIPADAPYKAFGSMNSKYGPIITLNAMGTRYVVLNSLEAANVLLEKKSAITANRPHFTMGGELVGWGNTMVYLQYGDTYRKHRKFLHQQIGSKSSLEAFYPVEEADVKQFLCNVLKNPDHLIAHIHRTSSSIILKISHGYTVKEEGDPFVEMAGKAAENFAVVSAPGRFLVDTIPILKYLPEWFPGCGFHRDAKQWRRMLHDAVRMPYEFVLQQVAKGDAAPSLISRLLQEGVTPDEEEALKWASFSMYLGGSDTTPTALTAFFLVMAMHPEILKKAQAELDSVVGEERLPTIGDRDTLPYVNAICLELLRWHVVVPLITHLTTEDIFHEGRLIPKGTCLIGNIWHILSNPKTYPNPDVFDPERFLGDHQQPDPRRACFGYGRRSCPGAHLAESTIFICVAMALATLNVSRCVENGVELDPKYDVIEGAVRHIKPYKCQIIPRSKRTEDLLQS